ncbi:hydrolase, partial [bacterium]|nr:hydrolase [bacterium]
RVVNAAMQICQNERACWQVVLPAAWFHDYVIIPKKDPRRAEASRLSAQAALVYLESVHYPGEYERELRKSLSDSI